MGVVCTCACVRSSLLHFHQGDLALNESAITDRGIHLESDIPSHARLLERHHRLWSLNVARKSFPVATHLKLRLYGDQADGQ